MTKTVSIVLLSIITAIVLFLGVFSFIGALPSNDEGDFFASPVTVIQKANGFTRSIEATYNVDTDDDAADLGQIKNMIKTRLRVAYGYYGVSISYDKGIATITLPIRGQIAKTSKNEIADEYDILESVIANGKLEILSSTTYSKDNVVLSNEHYRRATVRSYVSGSNTWYLTEIKLTKEGMKLADDAIGTVTSLSNYFAIDGETESYYDYSNGVIRLYAHSREEAKLYASYVKTGALNATFNTEKEPTELNNDLGWVFLAIMGVLFVGSVVYMAIRYGDMGLVAALAQLIAVVVFTIFSGLVYLAMFNAASAIGVVIVYAFMTFFSVYTLDKISKYLADGKTYTSARYKGFLDSWKLNLICHGGLLVLGIILWVIPTVVTAPLGNVLVYGAILSFVATFALNRLFTHMLSPFHEGRAMGKAKK